LYDTFWANETGFAAGDATKSKLTQVQLDDIKSTGKFEFYRCKNCHGWDRLGQEGGYSNRASSPTRPGVAPINLMSISESASPSDLFNRIKTGGNRRALSADLTVEGNKMPDYSSIMTDAQIWDLVKFLKEKAVDTTKLYTLTLGSGVYPSRTPTFTNLGANGLASRGDALYASKCAGCHGADGTQIPVDGNYTVGGHFRAKPYEDHHKVKFGQLGSIMGPILKDNPVEDLQDLYKAMADTTKYPVAAPPNGSALYQTNCSGCHGALASSSKKGRTATQIQTAINGNVGGMGGLSALTPAQVAAIADALK
jgi:mono/diheme cytochrome c family protein